VAAKTNFGLWRAALLCLALVLSRPARADAGAPQSADAPASGAKSDVAVPLGQSGAPGVKPTTLRWHDTVLYWDHALSTNSLGVGQDYQSRDPVYQMTIGLRPRYYLFEGERSSVSVRGDFGVVTERTNSDTTTREGEWSATDFELYGAFSYRFRETKADVTELVMRLPRLTLPTSKVSYASGKLLGLGARVGLREDAVLEGRDAAFFPNVELVIKAEYGYLFTNSQVTTNGGLERIRLDPEGRSIVSDQLSGASLARHAAAFGVATLLHVHQRLLWTTALEIRPAWKYPINHDVQVCAVVLTGCTAATGISDPQTRSAITYFYTEFWVTLNDLLGVSLGYANLTAQLGPDGRRRSVFYSPDATFYATLGIGLDQLYSSLSGGARQSARSASASRSH